MAKIKKAFVNLKRNLHFLMKYDIAERENELFFRAKDETIEDLLYELDEDMAGLRTLSILNEWQTFDLLEKKPKSFCRLGDGEIYLIQGIDQGFQEYDCELAKKLEKLLSQKRDDMYVGINRAYFHSPKGFGEKNRRFYRLYGTELRRFFLAHCNPNNTYFDAGFLTAYYRFGDNYPYEEHYRRLKQLFRDRKILLVVGEGIFEKLDYNVFDESEDFRVIHGPRKNAYAKKDELIQEILQTADPSWTICIILGMTAKVMVEELTDRGFIAWDVGHAAKDYDAYMRKAVKNEEESRKFWDPD